MHARPQTFTRGNWPFLVFLIVLGTALAIPAWQMGNYGIAAALFSIGLGVAFVVFVIGRVVAATVAPQLLAIYEGGLLVRKRDERFIAWGELETLETWVQTVEVTVDEDHTFLKATTRDGLSVTLSTLGWKRDLLDLVRSKTGLTPADLGRKSGW